MTSRNSQIFYLSFYCKHTFTTEKCFLPLEFKSFPKAHKFTNDALEQKLLHLNSRRCQAGRNSLNPSHAKRRFATFIGSLSVYPFVIQPVVGRLKVKGGYLDLDLDLFS